MTIPLRNKSYDWLCLVVVTLTFMNIYIGDPSLSTVTRLYVDCPSRLSPVKDTDADVGEEIKNIETNPTGRQRRGIFRVQRPTRTGGRREDICCPVRRFVAG